MSFRWLGLGLLAVAMMSAGCAARRPVFYPNEQLARAGQSGADRDTDECMRLAEAYVSSKGKTATVARDAAVGGVGGAAIGAVGGAIYGDAGRGAAAGAATGVVAGLFHGLVNAGSPSPLYQNYVNTCLAERGYRVLGWE